MQSPAAQYVPVVIIGAGPTGIAAANMLGQRGVGCLVVERHRDIYPLPRTVHFDDEVFRILQSMGLADEVRAITRPMLGLQLLDAHHKPFARFQRDSTGHHGYPEANTFEQPELEKILRRGLTRYSGVELRCCTEVVNIEEVATSQSTPVRLTLRDTNSGRRYQVSTSAVLGCDGANSRTRTLVDTGTEDLGFTQSWLLVDVDSKQRLRHWDGVHQVCDPRGAITYMRVGPTRYRWQFQLKDNNVHFVPTAEDVERMIAPWLSGVDPAQVVIVRQTVFTFRAVIARRWRRDRIFLLGDAAHQAPPFLGQGMCAGLRDAANLTWKLALVLNGQADHRLLDTYESERRPHVRRMVQLAARQGRIMTGGPLRTAVVKSVLRHATRLRTVNRHMSRSMCPPLQAGPMVHQPSTTRPGRSPLAGQLCPQPRVTISGGAQVRLDDVLGDGFAIVAHAAEWDNSACTVAAARYFTNLSTRFVVIIPDDTPATPTQMGPVTFIRDTDGALTEWLNQGHAKAILLRPDRCVLAAGSTLDLSGWRRVMLGGGVHDDARRGDSDEPVAQSAGDLWT